jgi:hypothetical protein
MQAFGAVVANGQFARESAGFKRWVCGDKPICRAL